jgi:hypothetical protein
MEAGEIGVVVHRHVSNDDARRAAEVTAATVRGESVDSYDAAVETAYATPASI